MSDHVVYLEPAFVLNSRSYRESSLIVDILTRERGKLSMLVKGVKNKKSTEIAALLQPFNALLISFVGNLDGLRVLTNIELESPSIPLKGMRLYCGFYVNELLKYLLHSNAPCPEIFLIYQDFINQLRVDSENLESSLRLLELKLLENLGYGLQLTYDCVEKKKVIPEKKYSFIPDQGPVESENGFICGSTLLALECKKLDNKQTLMESKNLMRYVIDYYLQGRQLKSRSLIRKILQS